MVKHPVILQGLTLTQAAQASPLLLDRPAINGLQDLQADLADSTQWSALLDDEAAASELNPGTLAHPVQRSATVALTELRCNSVLFPRLDPLKIDSAGLVVRRVSQDPGTGQKFNEAWMTGSDGTRGWRQISHAECDLDPDPQRRKGLGSGNAILDQKYAEEQGGVTWAEAFTPMFVAPPALNAAIRKTVLYGIVPTADAQTATAGSAAGGLTNDQLQKTIPGMLKQGTPTVPLAGQTITAEYGSNDWLTQNPQPHFKKFLRLLQAAVVEYGIFDGTAEGQAVRKAIHQITATYPDNSTGALDDLLGTANSVLLGANDLPGAADSFVMPLSLSEITPDIAAQISRAIGAALAAKTAQLTPDTGRYDEPNKQYRVRAFARVKDTPQCPPRIVWTPQSAPYTIAPWYQPGKLPPVHVPLPDPTDRGVLQGLKKPTVTFGVSGGLQQLLQMSNMQGLMNGGAKPPAGGGGLTIDWICGFSIPIITICAFFVLNIFLSLLNIIFFWLPFVKICIPIPRKS